MSSARDIIHFSHANGFPAPVYRKMLGCLEADFDVGYIDAIGHDPNFPITDCWPHLVEQLIVYLESRYTRPVIAVGHSLGGFLSFLAAHRRPDLFKQVILLDSPIMGRLKCTGLLVSKQIGMIGRVTPADSSRRRRDEWASHEEAVTYFKGKPLYAHFDDESLRHYAELGTVRTLNGVRLLFRPEIEYQIYVALPHTFAQYRRPVDVPMGFLGGSHSHLVDAIDLRNMQRHHGIVCRQTEGGHLFPLEFPVLAAQRIRDMIDLLRQGGNAT